MFREVTRARQKLEKDECVRLLGESRRGVLSVIGDDGYPYGVPLNHWYCPEDGKLYFHSGKTGHKIDAIRACDKASYCVMGDGVRNPGEWWLTFRSVIVFGRIEIVADHERALEISRSLSYAFTSDEDYIRHEIDNSGPAVLVFALVPEHITGKTVREK